MALLQRRNAGDKGIDPFGGGLDETLVLALLLDVAFSGGKNKIRQLQEHPLGRESFASVPTATGPLLMGFIRVTSQWAVR